MDFLCLSVFIYLLPRDKANYYVVQISAFISSFCWESIWHLMIHTKARASDVESQSDLIKVFASHYIIKMQNVQKEESSIMAKIKTYKINDQ